MKKIYAIITGGEPSELCDIDKACVVIACDKGYYYATERGVEPDEVVGDFDSCDVPRNSRAEIVVLPKEKDDTDTVFAVKRVLSRYPDEIYMYCAEGGRPDHFIGNLQAAAMAAKQGVAVRIFGNYADYAIFSTGTKLFPKNGYSRLSVISLSDECRGVWIKGVKYPLCGATLTNSFPVGISNEWTKDVAEVSLESGIIAVIRSKNI